MSTLVLNAWYVVTLWAQCLKARVLWPRDLMSLLATLTVVLLGQGNGGYFYAVKWGAGMLREYLGDASQMMIEPNSGWILLLNSLILLLHDVEWETL